MKLKYLISIILLCFNTNIYSSDELVIDTRFFREFYTLHDLKKSEYLDKLQDKIVIARGNIKSVIEKEYLKRKYRITVEQSGFGKIKFIYHIYLNNKNTIDLLTENSFFEFKGQFIGHTSVDTKHSIYIIDIIYMDGSTIIK